MTKNKITARERREDEDTVKEHVRGELQCCLSSPPNTTHMRGLGNNESPHNGTVATIRPEQAFSLCARWLCWRLSFSLRLFPCDGVKLSLPPLPSLPSGEGAGVGWWRPETLRTGVPHKRADLYDHCVSCIVLWRRHGRDPPAMTSSHGTLTETAPS